MKLEYVVVDTDVGLHFMLASEDHASCIFRHLTHITKAPLGLGCPVFVAGLGTSFLVLLYNPTFVVGLIVCYLNCSCVETMTCSVFFRCVYIYISSSVVEWYFLCLCFSLGLLRWWEFPKHLCFLK